MKSIEIKDAPQKKVYYISVFFFTKANFNPLTLQLKHKMPKQFLNVQYSATKARINVTDMEDLSEVQDAIKAKLANAFSQVDAPQLQLYTNSNRDLLISTWALFNSLPPEYFVEGGSCVVVGTSPPPIRESRKNDLFEAGSISLLTGEENDAFPRKKQRMEISDLTTQLQSCANAQLVDGCLQSANDTFLPYPQDEIKKLFVRKCYEDVFKLLLKNIKMKSFAISGTPGIGKSLFFVYILYRLMKDCSVKTLSLQPNRIVYQMGSTYECFDLQQRSVTRTTKIEAEGLVREQDSFYVIDGQTTPIPSTCIALFISSPRSAQYKEFVKQKMAKEWYFPLWTLDELQTCQLYCYPDLSIEILKERHRICGGVARSVFHKDYSIIVPKIMEEALADVDAVKGGA